MKTLKRFFFLLYSLSFPYSLFLSFLTKHSFKPKFQQLSNYFCHIRTLPLSCPFLSFFLLFPLLSFFSFFFLPKHLSFKPKFQQLSNYFCHIWPNSTTLKNKKINLKLMTYDTISPYKNMKKIWTEITIWREFNFICEKKIEKLEKSEKID